MTNLAQKLGIRSGDRVCLLDAPPETAEVLRVVFPPGIIFQEKLGGEPNDIILFWPRRLEGLRERLAALQFHINPQGAIWVVIPKKKFAREQGIDFDWEAMQAAGLQTDLVDNKVATISEQEYGTRFVIRKDQRVKFTEKPG
jgi:hypothetical protein